MRLYRALYSVAEKSRVWVTLTEENAKAYNYSMMSGDSAHTTRHESFTGSTLLTSINSLSWDLEVLDCLASCVAVEPREIIVADDTIAVEVEAYTPFEQRVAPHEEAQARGSRSSCASSRPHRRASLFGSGAPDAGQHRPKLLHASVPCLFLLFRRRRRTAAVSRPGARQPCVHSALATVRIDRVDEGKGHSPAQGGGGEGEGSGEQGEGAAER